MTVPRFTTALVLIALAGAPTAEAGGNRVYLVPAIVECPGPATCAPREFASTYTFDTILLRTPAGRYVVSDKPSIVLDVRGVRDAAGALVDGTVTVRVLSGRVSLPGIGTFPDDSPLTRTAPQSVTLKKGRGRLAYRPPATPNGLIGNGGGVEVLDPDGRLLAVTGSQSKP